MIPKINHNQQPWRKILQQSIRNPVALASEINVANDEDLNSAHQIFPIMIPERFMTKIHLNKSNAALFNQVVPSKEELITHSDYKNDPVGDLDSEVASGIIHKYHGRVLLIASNTCAINCRYCFRRNYPYSNNIARKDNWNASISYIATNPSIYEVILSGGDPLLLSTKKLKQLTDQLVNIPHVKRLRIHTRIPIVLPERINHNLINWLNGVTLQKVIVTHCNHSDEIDSQVKNTIKQLQAIDITLLNQSVLLKSINDNAKILIKLSETLFEIGILPYYLHLLDKAHGTSHFDVSEHEAKNIMNIMKKELSGFLVPKLVSEQAGSPYKLPIL